ncbi:hypothetical protein [Oecophyllibacter saccharovorans]|uniref:hypothetical protein n=1 Tax=Oecophyllibacter saccharovorans TaxID=2558360 RepID=UPI0011687E6C|nr:hypothetical protein [Oecophyllibacter saccharovorans]TPW35175.1 hypothetical protein E3203_06855 [Oecophyllibacter saccharovorans]
MSDKRTTSSVPNHDSQDSLLNSCGIIMPISAQADPYTAEHWRSVRTALEHAIDKAKLTSKPVWDNPASETITSNIIKNIYEEPIIIGDISNHNANVMLEIGMRLSTKKPLILVKDNETDYPFDVKDITCFTYPVSLDYGKMDSFIKSLSIRLTDIIESVKNGSYTSALENINIEIASPKVKEVSEFEMISDKLSRMEDKLDSFNKIISKSDNLQQKNNSLESEINKEKLELIARSRMEMWKNLSPEELNSEKIIHEFNKYNR